jgi:general secretion pathway protein A
MNPRLLALYGLKWNPFAPAVPTEALLVTPRIDSFRRRVWQLAAEGGFALLTGAPAPASRPGCASSPSIWRSSAT